MPAAVCTVHLEVRNIHVSEMPRLQKQEPYAGLTVVSTDKHAVWHGVIIIAFIRKAHFRYIFRCIPDELIIPFPVSVRRHDPPEQAERLIGKPDI